MSWGLSSRAAAALGSEKRLLATVTLQAQAAGKVTFQADPADLVGDANEHLHDLLLFEPPTVVNGPGLGNNWDKVSFGTTSIVISAGGSSEGESSYTNPVNRLDVNGDSFVSPVDVLWVVNVTNTRGSGKLPSLTTAQGEGELTSARVPPSLGFVDVNGDGYLTPADTLLVVSFLN